MAAATIISACVAFSGYTCKHSSRSNVSCMCPTA
jgi:hypothetical protein